MCIRYTEEGEEQNADCKAKEKRSNTEEHRGGTEFHREYKSITVRRACVLRVTPRFLRVTPRYNLPKKLMRSS